MSDNSKPLQRKDHPNGAAEFFTTCSSQGKDAQSLLGEAIVAAACFLGEVEAHEITVRIVNGELTCLVDGKEEARGYMAATPVPTDAVGHA